MLNYKSTEQGQDNKHEGYESHGIMLLTNNKGGGKLNIRHEARSSNDFGRCMSEINRKKD